MNYLRVFSLAMIIGSAVTLGPTPTAVSLPVAKINRITKIFKTQPSSFENHYDRGIRRLHLGDHRGAIEDFNQAIRINPNNDDAYNNRGVARLHL